uniref:aurora kinase A and ninein-interacting protein isoform X2 n=1 Tax=Doryrhamphus excisus TaxID=161450 RepID=UPI0025AD9F74|nr:aurora kinase A and ninein-interacting protein isoform X2 [Doryrhamphus excisus]
MKKTPKAVRSACASEECGVWLDTVQMKGKAMKKREKAGSISKMLNPQGKGAGYSLAVVLSFTQTRIQMPKTKQSSITTFFSPRRPSAFPQSPLGRVSIPDVFLCSRCLLTTVQGGKMESEKTTLSSPSTERAARAASRMSDSVGCQAPEEQLEELKEFSFGMDVEGKSSPQKHMSSSQMDEGEEENMLPSYSSGRPSSHPTRLSRAASPLKPIQEPNTEENIHGRYSWMEAARSHREDGRDADEEDGLAMLFTQDSDGFRVMAHPGLRARSPLNDPSNATRMKANRAYTSPLEEEELLFTQDSQGNMLIKH